MFYPQGSFRSEASCAPGRKPFLRALQQSELLRQTIASKAKNGQKNTCVIAEVALTRTRFVFGRK
jgi:hypothetical protein